MKLHCRLAVILGSATTLVFTFAGCAQRQAALEAQAQLAAAEATREHSPGEDAAEGSFAFPSDRGGELLAELLVPPEKGRPAIELASDKRRVGDSVGALEPAPLYMPSETARARPVLEKPLTPRKPGAVPEAVPFLDQLTSPRLPETTTLVVDSRIRTPAPDVNEPLPLPILGERVTDRASLDDPTLEASVALALAASPPRRATRLPFIRLTLPNPFENRDALRWGRDVEELPMPAALVPHKP
jgi:hypothetical protein